MPRCAAPQPRRQPFGANQRGRTVSASRGPRRPAMSPRAPLWAAMALAVAMAPLGRAEGAQSSVAATPRHRGHHGGKASPSHCIVRGCEHARDAGPRAGAGVAPRAAAMGTDSPSKAPDSATRIATTHTEYAKMCAPRLLGNIPVPLIPARSAYPVPSHSAGVSATPLTQAASVATCAPRPARPALPHPRNLRFGRDGRPSAAQVVGAEPVFTVQSIGIVILACVAAPWCHDEHPSPRPGR